MFQKLVNEAYCDSSSPACLRSRHSVLVMVARDKEWNLPA